MTVEGRHRRDEFVGEVGDRDRPGSWATDARRISRADLAAAMLASIDDPALIGRTATIAS